MGTLSGEQAVSDRDDARPQPPDARESDIDHLRRELQMPAWRYVDFSAQRDCALALSRWPLLRELAEPAA